MPRKTTPAHVRIMRRVNITEQDCWEFQGAQIRRGYGVIQLGRGVGTALTHRVMWEHHKGPIPEGLTLDHLCANPCCCNPAHLEPVTLAENTRRQWRDGRADPGRANREKTHCPSGHPYDHENTRITPKGGRACRTCNRLRQRKEDHVIRKS